MAPPRLHIEGTRFVTPTGQTVILRGATLIRWVWKLGTPLLDYAVADALTKPRSLGGWGANCFTLWVDSDRVEDGTFWAYADEMVDIAEANNAYVIFAYHARRDELHPSRIDDAGINAMRAVAQRYRDRSSVLFITQAEPGDGYPDNRALSWSELKPHQERTIDAIRSVHSESVIGYSGPNWSQAYGQVLNSPIARGNLFVQPHLYDHPDRDGNPEFVSAQQMLDGRRIPEVKARFCTLIGEFGIEWPNDVIAYCRANGMSWQAWNCADLGNPVMLTSMDAHRRNAYGDIIYNALGVPIPGDPIPPPDDPKPPTKPPRRPLSTAQTVGLILGSMAAMIGTAYVAVRSQ